MADDASAGDIGLSNGVFYLNPPGVLSAGQSEYHPEGGKVSEQDIPPSARSDFQENIRTQQSRSEAEERNYLQRRQQEAQRLREIEGQRPKIPTEKLVGPAPDAREYQKDSMAFASSMAMLGALMAKGGRMSGANALAAFGGALKGWQEGNLEAYTNAVDKWKHETERTIENNRQLMQKYQLVMDNYRLNIDQQRANMEEIAVQNHDQMAYNVLKVGNMTAMAQLQDQRWNWTNGPKGLENTYNTLKLKNDTEVEKLKDLAQQYAPFISQVDQFVHKDGTPWTNQEKMMAKQIVQNYSPNIPGTTSYTGGGGRYGGSGRSPQDAAAIGDAIISGDQPPTLTGLYGQSPAVRSYLASKGFDLRGAQLKYTAAQRTISALHGPQMERFRILATTVQQEIDRVNELAAQMKQGGVPALNAAELATYIQSEGNSPKGRLATAYQTQIGVLKEKMANLVQGGYAPTEPAWKLANEQINGNYGVDQLGASLAELKRSIGYHMTAMDEREAGVTGGAATGGAEPASGGWGKASVE